MNIYLNPRREREDEYLQWQVEKPNSDTVK